MFKEQAIAKLDKELKEIKEPNGEIQYTVKLEDKGGYSIVYADPKDLRLKECKTNASTN